MCQPADLGRPIPASPHAVSVCLPTWADNVGYEQADPRVTGRMQCGYPRFFLHPAVVRLFQTVRGKIRSGRRMLLRLSVLPRGRTLRRLCSQRNRTRTDQSRQSIRMRFSPCGFPNAARNAVKAYWQHTGQVVSSRHAERILTGQCVAHGRNARESRRFANGWRGLMDVDPADVWLFPSGMAAIETAFRAFQRLRPTAQKRAVRLSVRRLA